MRFFILLLLGLNLPVFRVCASDFPKLFNTEPVSEDGLMPAQLAAERMKLPKGFEASVFAAEPDVQNPIAMAWDGRGRLWIAENYTYAERQQRFQLDLRDRVVIFDGTGSKQQTKRTVFTDQLQMLTGIEIGLNGVWLMCPPQLLFIPDRNHDDIPDSDAEVVLDGFHVADQNYHNFANGLRFGPDGWLYGRCGGSCPGRIGFPGDPDNQRLALEGGIWRYHPRKQQFEVLTTGTTNPWGHDWNEVGEAFFVNTVNGHLWHMIPGAHFTRPFTLDPNRKTYELIDFHADHWHLDTGKNWTDSRGGAANDYGGGHAHIGAMIYNGDNWPDPYRGKLFTLNMHGRRANQERLERHGSGYLAKHEPDFLLSEDEWFRGMDLSTGPDGSVFLIDWSDAGECHEHTGVHRTSGRIFKVQYGDVPTPRDNNLLKWSQDALADAHSEVNLWYTRQARLELIRRNQLGADLTAATQKLWELHNKAEASNSRLLVQTYLTLHGLGCIPVEVHVETLRHANEHLRAWAIRLLTEDWRIDDAMGPLSADQRHTQSAHPSQPRARNDEQTIIQTLNDIASSETSPLVRLTLASTLQRIPTESRVDLAAQLVRHRDDSEDHNLPLMIWYGLIAVSDQTPEALIKIAKNSQLTTTLRLIARSVGEQMDTHPENANYLLQIGLQEKSKLEAILTGFSQGLKGWQHATMPQVLPKVQTAATGETASLIQELSVLFGDGRAIDDVKALALDRNQTNVPLRIQAIETLIQNRIPQLRDVCFQLLDDNRVNFIAARGLASINEPGIGEQLVKNYNRFRGPKRPQIISILASRPEFAEELLQAISEGKIPKKDLQAYQVSQIKSFADTNLKKQVIATWGDIRDTPQEKQERIDELKTKLTAATSKELSKGRILFKKLCQNCHRLYGEGERIGPDLTGGNRSNLDYLLQNIIDPSSVVDKDYRMQIILLEDGRTLNGLITEQSDRTITLQTATERLNIDRREVEYVRKTNLSPMPDGLLDALSLEEINDLLSYLQHPTQVAIPNE